MASMFYHQQDSRICWAPGLEYERQALLFHFIQTELTESMKNEVKGCNTFEETPHSPSAMVM
jgi:hypothetical protein